MSARQWPPRSPRTGEAAIAQAVTYHRVCASYWTDENAGIPCVLD
jgi:hypothetical protein